MSFPILSYIIFIPLAGALLILFTPKEKATLIKAVAIITTLITFGLTVLAIARFNFSNPLMQFEQNSAWVPGLNIRYHLGIDGLSVALVFLAGLLVLLSCVFSYSINTRVKEYFFFYLILATGIFGVFMALDLFLFYIFWEIVLVPMYFLIGIWGGPKRQAAAAKFFIYTISGSVFMLLGILTLYFASVPHTFNILELTKSSPSLGLGLQLAVFACLFLGFAVKVPIFPFHAWLPDAHVEAPTAISVLLAGILIKMGAYGFFRVSFPILKDAAHYFAIPLAVLGTINIVYAAFVAMAQDDFKKMVAYSSISHMGFVVLGLASMTLAGFNGGILEMFNHGVISAGMFLLVGMLYNRAHTRSLAKFGGLGQKMPIYAGILSLFAFASFGLPGTSGFVSEFLSLAGAFPVFKLLTIISIIALVIFAVYFLAMLAKVLFGPLNEKMSNILDLNKREVLIMLPLIILVVVIGAYPFIALKYQALGVNLLVKNIGGVLF